VGEPLALRKVEFSLLLLLHANGPLAPKQLARTLSLPAPALTVLMDRLQAQGHLRREPNPQDGRSQHVVLTPAGRTLAARAADVARAAGLRFDGLWLEAPLPVLRARIAARRDDASDADEAVLLRAAAADPGPIDWHRIDVTAGGEAAARAALGIEAGFLC
jgi:DNA-binding MarR family transcriptional regulator